MLYFALSVIPLLLALDDGIPLWEQLQRLTWKNRVVVIYAPRADSDKLQQQRQQLSNHQPGARERDLVVIECIGPTMNSEDKNYLKRHFNHNMTTFGVWLIGKDGGTKLAGTEPIEASEFFELIDSMPMRKAEMKDNP